MKIKDGKKYEPKEKRKGILISDNIEYKAKKYNGQRRALYADKRNNRAKRYNHKKHVCTEQYSLKIYKGTTEKKMQGEMDKSSYS